MPKASCAVQVLPIDSVDTFAEDDATVGVVCANGITHEVGPMETTPEGDDPQVLIQVCLRARRAAFRDEAKAVQSTIRLIERRARLVGMRPKVRPYRDVGGL